MSDNKKRETTIYINHQMELLLWLIVILVIVAVSSLSFMHISKNDENDYQVFLPDVDGLIIGSPVKIMGVQVGHVVKIEPVKDEVYVKFVLDNKDVYIPQGSDITVEFSGMAGSKSLELYIPQDGKSVDALSPMIAVNPPKRLYDAAQLLREMYKKIGTIIYSVSSFSTKLNDANLNIGIPSSGVKDFEEFLEYSDNFLDNSTEKTSEVRKNIEGFKDNAKQVH
ncbi:MAG: MlaD family protein [bacterium]|nr:MlaD family protein [bacterium]